VQYEVEVDGQLRRATVHREDGRFIVELDGTRWTVDASRVDAQSLSLLIDETVGVFPSISDGARLDQNTASTTATGVSHEVTVVPDGPSGRLTVSVGAKALAVSLNGRRRRGTRDAAASGDGPQRIVAPMPGKVVRVLAAPGDAVQARQSVIVIEAMKMENELRAGRDGVVTELHAREGQSVEAGELLAVVAAAKGAC
jgi:biotin carboxyl carrier protein